MEKEINYFSISIKKIEGTEKDYELITCLNPCVQILPKEKIEQIEDIALKAVEDIKLVLHSYSTEKRKEN